MIFSRTILFLYLLVSTVDYFGAADKVDSQILYLNIINLINILVFIKDYKKEYINDLTNVFKNIPVICMGGFFIWSGITAFFAINYAESLISLSEIFTLWVSLIFIVYHSKKLGNSFISSLLPIFIVTITTIELVSVFTPYLSDIINFGKPNPRALAYRGISGNINVIAYSLLFKLPFLLYYLINKRFNQLFVFPLILLSTYAIVSIFETRSALLTLILISILFFAFYLKLFRKQQSFRYKTAFISIIAPLLLTLFFDSVQSNIFSSNNVQDRLETFSDISSDQSLSQRLRYYDAAFQSFKKHPIFGIGVGNWELESIRYEREYMTDYTVPYHAHNDYLEILAESGIFGFVLFFGPLFLIIILLLKNIFNKNVSLERRFFSIVLVIALLTYMIDSLFNFPQARIMQQMNLLLLITLACLSLNLKVSLNSKIIRPQIILILLLSFPSLYSAVKVYSSSKDQVILLRQFNESDFSKPSLDIIDKIQTTYPNVTATAMPIASMKAMHYMYAQNYDKTIEQLKLGLDVSPHLYFSESFLGYTYELIGQRDSALYYNKIAFENAPRDVIHYGNYLFSLARTNDSLLVKETYLKVEEKYRTPAHDEIYLLVLSSLNNPSGPEFTLDGIDINFQTGNDRLKKGYYMVQVGEDKMYEADFYYQSAIKLFETQKFEDAAALFIKASELNPYELAYLENAANAYMKIGKDYEALELLNTLIDELGTQSINAFYIRGLILYDLGETESACLDLKIADDEGLFASTSIYSSLCAK